MFESPTTFHRRWGIAWLGLAIALAFHVTDEALTGFLPLYNSIVLEIRESYSFIPLPTFTFPIWLGGLIVAVLILFLLSPLVFAGRTRLISVLCPFYHYDSQRIRTHWCVSVLGYSRTGRVLIAHFASGGGRSLGINVSGSPEIRWRRLTERR